MPHRNPRDGERRCGREMTTRVARERARPSREKRIETLGFSLETDDACGSLRVRDYERQLEIRSKQMDCENTSLLSLPPFLFLSFSSPPLTLSLFLRVYPSLFPFLSSSLTPYAQHLPGGGYKRLGPPIRRFSCIYIEYEASLLAVGWRNLNTDKMNHPLIAK